MDLKQIYERVDRYKMIHIGFQNQYHIYGISCIWNTPANIPYVPNVVQMSHCNLLVQRISDYLVQAKRSEDVKVFVLERGSIYAGIGPYTDPMVIIGVQDPADAVLVKLSCL